MFTAPNPNANPNPKCQNVRLLGENVRLISANVS